MIKFKDKKHEANYKHFLKKANVNQSDNERKALLYILSLYEDIRGRIEDVYNFKESQIRNEGLNKPWQTGSTVRATRLAFNLYNGWCGFTDDELSEYTPKNLFCDLENLDYLLLAVKIRFQGEEMI